jgi:hypothetical protein
MKKRWCFYVSAKTKAKTRRCLSNMQKGDGIDNSYQKSEIIQNWQSLGSNN